MRESAGYVSHPGDDAMRNNERSVYQYDLHIKKRAVHAPTPDLSSIINALKTVIKALLFMSVQRVLSSIELET